MNIVSNIRCLTLTSQRVLHS